MGFSIGQLILRREVWVWKKVKEAEKKILTAYHNLIKIQYSNNKHNIVVF